MQLEVRELKHIVLLFCFYLSYLILFFSTKKDDLMTNRYFLMQNGLCVWYNLPCLE